jgi:hypothetical protein
MLLDVKIEVTSHKQSGGVTAGNIGKVQAAQTEQKKSLFWRLVALVPIVTAVVAVLTYLGIKLGGP